MAQKPYPPSVYFLPEDSSTVASRRVTGFKRPFEMAQSMPEGENVEHQNWLQLKMIFSIGGYFSDAVPEDARLMLIRQSAIKIRGAKWHINGIVPPLRKPG